ncbi:MAG: SRPBCC family protein [Asticcacaulis sp.]
MDKARNNTAVERRSDRELVVTRHFNAPARLVFEAWTSPELFMRWWAPKSSCVAFISCDMDARTGGSYRLVFRHPASGEPMAFHGKYIEVIAPSRIVWTNEEGDEAGPVTTVTFAEKDGQTTLILHDLYPSKAALDEAVASGSTSGYGEQFEQLDALIPTL